MKRSDLVIAPSIFIACLALYIRTLAQGLLFGDSAEFQTIAYTMVLGHPTGYPVYVFLAKIFTYLPIGEIAYRVNLLSAVTASVTITFIYLIIRTLGPNPVSALFASLILALTPLFWKHAAIAEVYAISSACLVLILFALFRWKESKNSIWLFLAGMFGGLSLGIHAPVALAAPAVLMYLTITGRSAGEKPGDRVKPALFGALVGLIIFLLFFYYLDHRNSPAGYYNTVALPSLSAWGMKSSDFNSPLKRLEFLFFPPQFKGQFLAVPFDEVIERSEEFVQNFAVLLVFSLMGILSFFIPFSRSPARSEEGWFLIAALVIFMIFAVTYNVHDFNVFYIPSILILVICAGCGVQRLVDMIRALQKFRLPAITIAYIVCYWIGIGHLAGNVPNAWLDRIPPGLEEKDRYGFQFPQAYKLKAEMIVTKIEDDSIVFTDWDKVYDLYYVSHVLQGRTNMDFHQVNPQTGTYLLPDSMLAYIDANIDLRPIYFTKYPSSLAGVYKVIPAESGLFQILK